MRTWTAFFLAVTVFGFAGEAPPSSSRRLEGYRGIWFAPSERSKSGDKYSGGLATYSAHHTPLAVYDSAAAKTFFVYGGTPEGSRHLLCMVGSFDHKTGRVARPVVVHDKGPVDDPHDNPSLSLDADGYLWVFVSGRAALRPGYLYRSVAPHDLSRFERVAEKPMTYPQPWHVPGKGFLLLFSRYASGRELVWETSADGSHWNEPRKLATFGGHYQTSAARGGTIGTFFNHHPGGSADRRTNLYYVQTADFGATWTAVDGRPLALPLVNATNPALVADYAAQGRLVYPCDLNFDAGGNPILLYILARDSQPGPDGGGRAWTLAHWKGGRWNFSTITTSDHNYDMGSLQVLAGEWRVVGPTDPGPRQWTAGGEMVLWVSGDEGRTWMRRRAVTHDSEFNHSFARRVQQAQDPFFTFWADGDPNQLSQSRLYFCDSTGEHVWRLPWTFPDGVDSVEPERVKE